MDTNQIKVANIHKKSMNKMKEIGRDEINKHNMFVKFYCTPEKTI